MTTPPDEHAVPTPDLDSAPCEDSTPDPDDWADRWAEPRDSSADPAPSDRGHRRPRITHLVLLDGLPADHWVEDAVDGQWATRPVGRRARPRLLTDETVHRERELRWLDILVGGRPALLALDEQPLVHRPLDLAGIAGHLRTRAESIAARCDEHVAPLFGEEAVAAARALLEAALAVDPEMLERSARDDTAFGAIVWATGQANGLIGPEGQVLARDLWPLLGVPPSAAGRGAAMLERLAPGADCVPAPPGAPRLRATGRPAALLAATRALLVARRDQLLARA